MLRAEGSHVLRPGCAALQVCVVDDAVLAAVERQVVLGDEIRRRLQKAIDEVAVHVRQALVEVRAPAHFGLELQIAVQPIRVVHVAVEPHSRLAPARMLVRHGKGLVHVEVVDDLGIVKDGHILQAPDVVVVDAADDNGVFCVHLADRRDGARRQRVPARGIRLHDLVEQLKEHVPFARIALGERLPDGQEPCLRVRIAEEHALLRLIEGESRRPVQIQHQVDPRFPAPGDAVVQIGEPALLVDKGLVVVLDQRIVEGHAHVIKAEARNALNILFCDEAVEVVVRVALQVACVLGDPAAQVHACHVPIESFHVFPSL